MSETIKANKNDEFEELRIRSDVWNSNWRDDVSEEKENEDAQIGLEYFENENEYKNKNNKISAETMRRIELFRIKNMKIGQKVLSLRKVA